MDKLHVYTMTWNEEYMIKYFLRYYETVAEKIFVIDDNSDDKTKEIVKSCSKATLLPYPFPTGFNEDEKTLCYGTEYRKHSRGQAEWVIIVDCDEFVVYQGGELRPFLDKMRAQGRRALKPCGHFFASREIPNTDGQLFDAMPYHMRKCSWDKQVIFDPQLDVIFGPGSHDSTFSDSVQGRFCGLSLYHCCWLSKEWIREHYYKRLSRMTDAEYRKTFGINVEPFIKKSLQHYESVIASYE